MDREQELQREISTTTRWGVGIIVTMILQAGGLIYWMGGVVAQVDENTKDIAILTSEVNDIERDIRAILIGIEQVKTRLGIVENHDI